MALPNELILEVCKCLAKRDLKTCRLLSKSWSNAASECLFRKIYISPRKEDIEVFNLITQHTQLSHCVKRLEYDGTTFSPCYTEHGFRRYLRARGLVDCNSHFILTCVNNTDQQYIQAPKSCSEGHREWKARDEYQQRIVKNGDFLQTLTRGLRKLDLLNSVEVRNTWGIWEPSDHCMKLGPVENMTKYSSNPYFYASPFGRAWGLFRPKPHSWVSVTAGTSGTSQEEIFATGREEFQIITTALSQSQRHILSFHISSPPVSTFDLNVTESLANHSINAYSSLEDLTLNIDDYDGEVDMLVKYGSLPSLQALLGSMGGLRRLEMALPCDVSHGDACFNYRQIFPTDGTQWTRLIKLDIAALAISVDDLVNLLTAKTPNLRELIISDIELLGGPWEGVIEFLKTSMHLLSFRVYDCSKLKHLEGRVFLGDGEEDDESLVFHAKIEEYVVSGGRHPCLRPDEDVSASRRYLLDLGL